MAAPCLLCPRHCGADRTKNPGLCGAGEIPLVARAALHHWEEPMFSGTRGSGAVFFSGCNLKCLFCQNYAISAQPLGERCKPPRLAELFLQLQSEGAHNINLVTPSPHLTAILEALQLARAQGLRLPVLYNTSAYERVDALKALDGLVDIYLPDLKYVNPKLSAALSGAADYFLYAAPAIAEMQRQVGSLVMDGEGIAYRGLCIRHLVLPGCLADTRAVLSHIHATLPPETYVSLMCQYVPSGDVLALPPALRRRLTRREYERAVAFSLSLGMEHVFIQNLQSANACYTPAFSAQL